MDRQSNLAGMEMLPTAALFGGAAVLLAIATRVVIPWLHRATGLELVLCWFLAGGIGVFLPLLVAAWAILRREHRAPGESLWRDRLRFRRMTGPEWAWSLGGLLVVGAMSMGLLLGMRHLLGTAALVPSFLEVRPLAGVRLWILAAWVPFWFLNIMGEEILWRGTMLPRQERSFGQWAWLVHAVGWGVFHTAFGPVLLVTVVPALLVLPYLVQRRQNTWVGVVIHSGLNGPAFIAIALGLL
ncbi:MAG: CPBP family intramembrane metalloprotease [Gemmatimonadales bacterium]|nr:CPBP family intramembrane metalloprotease [Gemmatimonadales bacterium]NIN12002.1 CPBP family intramembrane metalloprotease [Gemmatimonadales bacterium]NIN50533.1 CPBP family intramembrane metalloprotease [Gemmatimonadales bacterium]NIP07997.1 CPBP family intramembrane metalloprotease [Gemmatimonadales bacterium]NIR00599.1 CPBP family intramembrane metalloprotease [Gemmatimonadales bacterium]